MIKTYQQAREYLEGFIHASTYKRIEVGMDTWFDPLARARYLLHVLGDPHLTFPSVIVSGTSGKGSTTYMIAHMLAAADYRVGCMSSPHLQKINERIQISNGRSMAAIADQDLVELLNYMHPIITSMADSVYGSPTYYEILAAATLLHFSRSKVDIAAVEVGLEGKLEVTNLMNPYVFVLTNIGLDHTAILGDTVEKIAEEATYRIRDMQVAKGVYTPAVVSGVTQPGIRQLVTERAARASAVVRQLGADFSVTNATLLPTGVFFHFQNTTVALPRVHTGMLGVYQATNAALAVEAVMQLRDRGFTLTDQALYEGLAAVQVPGRFEVEVYNGVRCIIDGAHNEMKMQAFCESLHMLYARRKKIFLVAFKHDKDIASLLQSIDQEADAIVLSRFISSVDLGKNLGMPIEEARRRVAQAQLHTARIIYEEDSSEALRKAHTLARQEDALLVVTGSMYFIGEIKDEIDRTMQYM